MRLEGSGQKEIEIQIQKRNCSGFSKKIKRRQVTPLDISSKKTIVHMSKSYNSNVGTRKQQMRSLIAIFLWIESLPFKSLYTTHATHTHNDYQFEGHNVFVPLLMIFFRLIYFFAFFLNP